MGSVKHGARSGRNGRSARPGLGRVHVGGPFPAAGGSRGLKPWTKPARARVRRKFRQLNHLSLLRVARTHSQTISAGIRTGGANNAASTMVPTKAPATGLASAGSCGPPEPESGPVIFAMMHFCSPPICRIRAFGANGAGLRPAFGDFGAKRAESGLEEESGAHARIRTGDLFLTK